MNDDRIERALKVLKLHPYLTIEDKNCEGFDMAHFYSQMVCAAAEILEGKQ